MVDNDEYNDEYQLTDLDSMGTDGEETEGLSNDSYTTKNPEEGSTVKRNALIAVSVLIISIMAYKFIGAFISVPGQPTDNIAATPPITPIQQPLAVEKPVQSVVPAKPVFQAPTQAVSLQQPSPDTIHVNDKLSALDVGQENLKTQVNTVNNQLSGVTSDVRQLAEKIDALNSVITQMTMKVEQQSKELAMLTEQAKPKEIIPVVVKKVKKVSYYIQAVIPGRAWLISTNGTTLTVREGTQIAGYGMVRMIDANRGRVVTSSGKVIKFSQEDS